MKRVFFLGHILVPLGLGGLGYLLLGGDTYFSSWLYRCLEVSRPDLGCPAFLRSYLLDMLWAYGLTAAVVWVMERPGVVFGICCAVEVGVECLQGLGIFSGTFDPMDMLLEGLATITALWVIKKHSRRLERSKP